MGSQRQEKMAGGSKFGDTRWTKIFVGGLAWETHSDTIKAYFHQFGDILEAVVISDNLSSKSKGYGFVTFKNHDSAMKACQNPYPVIDGRRANCNLAYFGASLKNRPTPPHHQGMEELRQGPSRRPSIPGGSMYYHQPLPHNAFPYPAYGYPSYPQDVYVMNYYNNAYGWYYYSSGVYSDTYRPFYAQWGQNSPKLAEHRQQYHRGLLSAPTLATPPSLPSSTDEAASAATATSEQKSSA